MKKIENLTVTCKYSVSLSDIDVPDDVYDTLMDNYELDPDDCRNTKEKNLPNTQPRSSQTYTSSC